MAMEKSLDLSVRERVDSGHFQLEKSQHATVLATPITQYTSAITSLPPTEATGPKSCNENTLQASKRSQQLSAELPDIMDNQPGPPFTFGNRLGFIQNDPIQGPMTRISHGMQLFDEEMESQVESRHNQIKQMANDVRISFGTHSLPTGPAQLIYLHDPSGQPINALELANAQAEAIQEQENEILAMEEALDRAWSDIEMLRLELWRRTSGCQTCAQDRSEDSLNSSRSDSQDTDSRHENQPFKSPDY